MSYYDSDDESDYEEGLTLPESPPKTIKSFYERQGKTFTLQEITAQHMHMKMNKIDEKTYAMAEYFNQKQDGITSEKDHYAEKYRIHNVPIVPGENEFRQCNANDLVFFDNADMRKNARGKLDAKDKIILKRLRSVPEAQKNEIPFSRIQSKVLAKYICLDIELNATFDKIWENCNLDINSKAWKYCTQKHSQKYLVEYFEYFARIRFIKMQQRDLLYKAFSGRTTPWGLCGDFVKNNVYYPTNKTDLMTGEIKAESRMMFRPTEKEKMALTKAWTWGEWEKSVQACKNHNEKNMLDEENFSNTHQGSSSRRYNRLKGNEKTRSSKSASRGRSRGRSRQRSSTRERSERSRSRNDRSSSRRRRSVSRGPSTK